jgi:negative regulator of flagellin synthesis FlgM
MKIDSSSNSTLAGLQNGLQRASNNGAKSNAVDGVQQSGDAKNSTVSLSTLSSDMRSTNSSDIDTAKVESIKSALRDGSYTPDSSKIAAGMLSTARDMMQSRTRPSGV